MIKFEFISLKNNAAESSFNLFEPFFPESDKNIKDFFFRVSLFVREDFTIHDKVYSKILSAGYSF